MPHMMDDFPLRMSTLYDNAARLYGESDIVSVESDGSVVSAIGTFAWNNRRHNELCWATANSGRICHTLNIRLPRAGDLHRESRRRSGRLRRSRSR